MWRTLLLALSMSIAAVPASSAPYYEGSWTVVSSEIAPWGTLDTIPPDALMKRLTGSRIVFKRHGITGPTPLACSRPDYRTRPYTLDMLFQGNLRSPSSDGARLGFTKPLVRTLETSCEDGPEFHFVDATTALFALDNRIYRMVR